MLSFLVRDVIRKANTDVLVDVVVRILQLVWYGIRRIICQYFYDRFLLMCIEVLPDWRYANPLSKLLRMAKHFFTEIDDEADFSRVMKFL